MKSHYEVLDVERDATADEIKKAYRKRVLEQHPDRHPGDKGAEERFKNTNLAYGVLSDPTKRTKYDIGFSASGYFDPSTIDPSLLDPETFVKTFSGIFGAYLDEVIPGGIKGRVKKAAAQAAKKKKSKKAPGPVCSSCDGSERIALKQGAFTMFVACRACDATRKAG